MVKNPHAVWQAGVYPGLGRFPREGNGYPLQYSRMENSMDRGAWWTAVHRGHKESDRTESLSLSLSLQTKAERIQHYQKNSFTTKAKIISLGRKEI